MHLLLCMNKLKLLKTQCPRSIDEMVVQKVILHEDFGARVTGFVP